jgi:hypothetical protein
MTKTYDDPVMEASAACVAFAAGRMSEQVLALGTNVDHMKEYEAISAWSTVVGKCADMWLSLGRDRGVFPEIKIKGGPEIPEIREPELKKEETRNYFDYIAPLKKMYMMMFIKPPGERMNGRNEALSQALGSFVKDPTLDYVIFQSTHTFEVKNEVIYEQSTTGRLYFMYHIPRECSDAVADFVCSCDFELTIGVTSVGKNEKDALLLVASMFHDVTMKIFVPEKTEVVSLLYTSFVFNSRHRSALSKGAWDTKNLHYKSGLARAREVDG